jgi:hypothetical protein
VLVTVWTAAWAWWQWSPSGISWHYFAEGSRSLLHADGLHTYAVAPTLQIGPLALLVAGAFGAAGSWGLPLAQIAMTALALVVVRVVADHAPPGTRHTRILATGLVLAPTWTVLSVRWAHVDDVLALTLLAALVWAITRPGVRPVLAGLAVAGACAAKPWAVIGLPVLLALPARRERAVGIAVALTGVAAAWAPFVLADPGTLAAMHPSVGVGDTSIMWWLGYHESVLPTWDRLAQLVGAPAVALVAVLRGRWPAALLVGIAVRLALDPQDLSYYAAGAVVAALVLDLWGLRTRVPWVSLMTTLVLWQPFVADYARRLELSSGWARWWFEHPGAVALSHALWVVAVLAVAFGAWPRSRVLTR